MARALSGWSGWGCGMTARPPQKRFVKARPFDPGSLKTWPRGRACEACGTSFLSRSPNHTLCPVCAERRFGKPVNGEG